MYDLSWSNLKIKLPQADASEEIEIPLVYRYSSEQTGTPLENEYLIEKARMNLDKFNLYYVAFTRASERLYVVLEEVGKTIEIPSRLNELVKIYLDKKGVNRIFGNGEKIKGWYSGRIADKVEVKYQNINTQYETTDWHQKLVISKRSPAEWGISEESNSGQDKNKPDEKGLSALEYGKLVHRIFSEVNDFSEIKPIIERELGSHNDPGQDIKMRLLEIADKLEVLPESANLFGGGVIIKEQEIITPDGETYRPDRVVVKEGSTFVIDFKTGLPAAKHKEQVLFYLNLIEKMNYPKPVGYIIYLGEQVQILEITKREEALLI